jgi:hypothetical protein
MGIESGRSPGVPGRNGETSETGGCSDGKALSYSSCRVRAGQYGTLGKVKSPARLDQMQRIAALISTRITRARSLEPEETSGNEVRAQVRLEHSSSWTKR